MHDSWTLWNFKSQTSLHENGICIEKFPKELSPNTVAVFNGYRHYRLFDNGRVVIIKGNQVDKRWVVPYNPWLSKKYRAHIIVEACMIIMSIMYLYRYIYKGHDCANVLINEQVNHDELMTTISLSPCLSSRSLTANF